MKPSPDTIAQGRYFCMECCAPAFTHPADLAAHKRMTHAAQPLPVFISTDAPSRPRCVCPRCGALITACAMTNHQRGSRCVPMEVAA